MISSIFQTTSKYIAEILLESASEKRIFLGISDFSWKVAKSLAHRNEIHDFLITSFIWKYAGNVAEYICSTFHRRLFKNF